MRGSSCLTIRSATLSAAGADPTIDRPTIGREQRLVGRREKIALRLTGGRPVKCNESCLIALQLIERPLLELDLPRHQLRRVLLLLLGERLGFVELRDLGLPIPVVHAGDSENRPAKLFGCQWLERRYGKIAAPTIGQFAYDRIELGLLCRGNRLGGC